MARRNYTHPDSSEGNSQPYINDRAARAESDPDWLARAAYKQQVRAFCGRPRSMWRIGGGCGWECLAEFVIYATTDRGGPVMVGHSNDNGE